MNIRVTCPSCRKAFILDKNMQGKVVVCRDCKAPFAIAAPAPKSLGEENRRASDKRITSSVQPASAARRADRDKVDVQRSWPREQRSHREVKDTQGRKNIVLLLVSAGVAALLLMALFIGGVVLIALNRGGSSKSERTVANESSPTPVAGRTELAPLAAKEPPPGPTNNTVEPPPVPVENKVEPPPAPVENKVEPPPAPAEAPSVVPPAKPDKGNETALPPGPVPAEMAADIIKKVKNSTVYLRVSLPSDEIVQGSGFFALERGIVITNAHVVRMKRSDNPPRNVEVIVHSGETGEFKLAGTILGLDRENDLAVLRVGGDLSRLPPPLPVASASELTETQNVYIFGFPFGAQLGKNITISKSAISSLRRGDNGVLNQVQVNGGMNPGNSGGPVCDASGVVIGVSVAIISGTQINFAVPGDFIQPLVERSKKTPLDLTARPGPVAKKEPPAGPPPGAGLGGDLAALKGIWQSGPVGADGGGATGTVKLSISPQPGSRGGRIRLEIATKQGARTTSSSSDYAFTLEQNGSERFLVTAIRRGARGTTRGMVFIYRFEGGQLILSGVIASSRLAYRLKNVALRRTAAEAEIPADPNPAPPAPATPAPPPPVARGEERRDPNQNSPRTPTVAPRPSHIPKGEELTKLLADLKSDEEAARQRAVGILQQTQALQGMDAKVAETAVLPLLSDSNVFIRCAAIQILAEMGSRDCVAPLEKLAKENDFFHSGLARQALVSIIKRSDRTASLPTREGPSAEMKTPGLLAYWSFEDGEGRKASDCSGNGLHAMLVNAAWSEGIRGKALRLTGQGSYLDFGNSPRLSFAARAPFTIAFWTRTTRARGTLLSLRNSRDGSAIIDFLIDGGKAKTQVRQDGNEVFGPTEIHSEPLNDGNWHHVALMREGDSVELFLDGVSQGRKSGNVSGGAITTDLRALGAERYWQTHFAFGDPHFEGDMDEFCIFDRLLKANEIAALALH